VRKRATHGTTQSTASKRTTAQHVDQKVVSDSAEVPQIADGDTSVLVMQQGIPVFDAPHLLRIGAYGPPALEDVRCREKLCYFDYERIPVRVMYARGFGAPGYFEPYESLAAIMKAGLFQHARSPNFPHIPISASTCPVHYVQQDRPIAMGHPQEWVNYKPNGWSNGTAPRLTREGLSLVPKLRLRSCWTAAPTGALRWKDRRAVRHSLRCAISCASGA
jgi:catalase